MLSALMHNMASMNVATARRLSIVGVADSSQVRRAQIGAASVRDFDELIGTLSLGSLVKMLRAQCHVLEGRYREALDLFDAHMDAALSEGFARLKCALLADLRGVA